MKNIGEIKKLTKDKLLHLSLIPTLGTNGTVDCKSDVKNGCDFRDDSDEDSKEKTRDKEVKDFDNIVVTKSSPSPSTSKEQCKPMELKDLMNAKDVPKITYFFEKPNCDKNNDSNAKDPTISVETIKTLDSHDATSSSKHVDVLKSMNSEVGRHLLEAESSQQKM